jgi:hypothetical protein
MTDAPIYPPHRKKPVSSVRIPFDFGISLRGDKRRCDASGNSPGALAELSLDCHR